MTILSRFVSRCLSTPFGRRVGGRRAAVAAALVAVLACSTSPAIAEVISIDGGSSWTGWTLRGISDKGSTEGTLLEPGIYGRGDSAARYRVYSSSFLFDSADNFKTGTTTGTAPGAGSTGFGSSGTGAFKAFANGNKVLGIGVEVLAGTIPGFNTIRLNNSGNAYVAATTVAANNGKASFSANSQQGDWTVQFYTSGTSPWTIYTLNSQAGNPGGPVVTPDSTRSIGSPVQSYSNLPFRAFGAGTGPTFTSYQMFFDLDAAYQLFGPNNGFGATIGASPNWFPIGAAGSNMSFSLNGVGTNDTAFGVAIVPEPSSQAMLAMSLVSLAAGALATRRMRGPRPR
jgi:hypothetical protein